MFTQIKVYPRCAFSRHKSNSVCNSFQEAPQKKAGWCPYLLLSFSLILPAVQNAAALAGGQEAFLDQAHQTKDSGPMRALELDP